VTVTCMGLVEFSGLYRRFAIWNGDCNEGVIRPQFALTFQTRDGAVDTSVAPSVEWVK